MKKIKCEQCEKTKNANEFKKGSDVCIRCENEIQCDEGLDSMDEEEREGYENLIEYYNKD